MISIVPFNQRHEDAVLAFWQSLHPDWTWLRDRERVVDMFAEDEDVERKDYVVRSDKSVIATVFTQCVRRSGWLPSRFVHIETRPATLGSRWLEPLLEAIEGIDQRGHDTWHVINVEENLLLDLQPILELAGFSPHSKVLRVEWTGQFIRTTDAGPVLFERYAGGSLETDQAIVDLYERSFRRSRFAAPLRLQRLWKPWPGQQFREYALGWMNDSLVGLVEWGFFSGTAVMNTMAVARSCWGTGLAQALMTWVMQIILQEGHRSILGTTQSNNAASIAVQQKLGWQINRVLAHTFVRKLQ